MAKKQSTLIILVVSILFYTGCKSGVKKETAIQKSYRGVFLDEKLTKADSLLVAFYKDPYGSDSLRYTRYYTQAIATDSFSIKQLNLQAAELFTQSEKRNCRSEGKIWCFASGKIFQTLYFSTRCDDCCYMYLIKDGELYYSNILPSVTNWLKQLKTTAVELKNDGKE
jgi:hypothetical protein